MIGSFRLCVWYTQPKKYIVKEEEMNLELNWSSGECERKGGGGEEALQGSGAQSLGTVSLHGRASCTASGL